MRVKIYSVRRRVSCVKIFREVVVEKIFRVSYVKLREDNSDLIYFNYILI